MNSPNSGHITNPNLFWAGKDFVRDNILIRHPVQETFSEINKIMLLPTCITHEFPRNLLVAAAAAEDLTTKSTVMPPTESGKLLAAIITLFTLVIGHPVLL